ncbi:MAG: hypothetical protein M0Z94_06180 [Dehalococcoidales bacterium]|nr:hypothetical protein [Dehalococcoidales bacterium]
MVEPPEALPCGLIPEPGNTPPAVPGLTNPIIENGVAEAGEDPATAAQSGQAATGTAVVEQEPEFAGKSRSGMEEKATPHIDTVPPEKRGGGVRGPHFRRKNVASRSTSSVLARPEVICWECGRVWMLGVELPNGRPYGQTLCIRQGGKELSRDPYRKGRWLANSVNDPVIVTSNGNGGDEGCVTQLSEAHGCLLFKMNSQDDGEGRLVASYTRGCYLAVVPEDWRRDEALAGPPSVSPQPVNVAGYRGHFFDIPSGPGEFTIAFRTSSGQTIVLERRAPRFEVVGTMVEDAGEGVGPLLGGDPPRIRSTTSETVWQEIGTVVVGAEGRGRRRWRTSFNPDPGASEQDLPNDVARRKSGWYFVRFYDLNDEFVESLDFRYVAGLREIIAPGGLSLLSKEGYSPAGVEVRHEPDIQVRPARKSMPGIETRRTDFGTEITIPSDQAADVTNWTVGPSDSRAVTVTLAVRRIWWALSETDHPPAVWSCKPVEVPRDSLSAVSPITLWLKLPNSHWAEQYLVGFGRETARRYRPEGGSSNVCVPLRDFADAPEAGLILGRHDLAIWLVAGREEGRVVLGSVLTGLHCRLCGQEVRNETEALAHIRTSHLDESYDLLTYAQLHKLERRVRLRLGVPEYLPPEIYLCKCCDYYIAAGNIQNPTGTIYKHSKEKHPGERVRFRRVTDIDEIRDNVIRNLPKVHRCKQCDVLLANPTQQALAQHLYDEHRQVVYA